MLKNDKSRDVNEASFYSRLVHKIDEVSTKTKGDFLAQEWEYLS